MEAPNSPVIDNDGHEIPFDLSGSYPVRPGNRLRLLIGSGPAFSRIGEAIDNATHRVWLTIAFVRPDFEMPDGRGSFLDVLDRAATRGVDVRVIFWRPNLESARYGKVFAGTQEDFRMLRARGARFRARWDRAPNGFCQHQKSWLIDAGQQSETAFVGGINPTFELGGLGDMAADERHDIYVEVTGPSASDVHHNFVQRWNEASERHAIDGRWANDADDSLAFPARVARQMGGSTVQIQRNVHAGLYANTHAAPGNAPYDIAAGERSISNQYLIAIRAARRSIYIENQALPEPAIAVALRRALERGVQVVLLVPGEPEDHVRRWREDGARNDLFDRIHALGNHDNFTLSGLTAPSASGGRRHVYVHAKIMLVDDRWATIGSCNLHSNSLNGHSEMNAAVCDRDWVKAMRCQLLLRHLGEDTAGCDDRSALKRFRAKARSNAERFRKGNLSWDGNVFEIAPASYGK
ncbi:MAG: phosphatidylserine/phosphatidylglycerophosphate/cardiolipin synthase family protein [Burkholderia gladioli]